MLTSRAHKLDGLAETDGCSASSERMNRRDQCDWPKGLPEACFAIEHNDLVGSDHLQCAL